MQLIDNIGYVHRSVPSKKDIALSYFKFFPQVIHNAKVAPITDSPTQLVETELLPKFNAKVKMEAKGWYLGCEHNVKQKICADQSKSSDKPA